MSFQIPENARQYTADDIRILEGDVERVKTRPTTFIPDTNIGGVYHIFNEIIDNAIDELDALFGLNPGGQVTVIIDETHHEITFKDNGRAIPHEKFLKTCTVLNSSAKFENTTDTVYTTSGGTNGEVAPSTL